MKLWAYVASAFGALMAVLGIYLKGKSYGKQESEAKHNEEKLIDIAKAEEIQQEVKIKVQEADNAANSQDRDSLINSLSIDSVRSVSVKSTKDD